MVDMATVWAVWAVWTCKLLRQRDDAITARGASVLTLDSGGPRQGNGSPAYAGLLICHGLKRAISPPRRGGRREAPGWSPQFLAARDSTCSTRTRSARYSLGSFRRRPRQDSDR